MDRSWLKADRRTKEFKKGVDDLLMFAFENGYNEDKISCPYLKCAHNKSWKARIVKNHLFQYGIDETYTRWIWHGEPNPVESDSSGSVNQAYTGMGEADEDDDDFSSDSSDFINHVEAEHEPLYPGCENYSKMKALVKLFNLKVKHGMGYEKIHACPNNCLLYRGQIDEDETTCRICKASRWKLNKKGEEQEGVPTKVLWYFLLIPRIRNLFNTPQIAKDMTWHETEREQDGKLRHPADSQTWKNVDQEWPDFASESKNLRLALSSDGFNPFHGNRTEYSSWPVLLSGVAPIPLTGEQVLGRVHHLRDHVFGKTQRQPRWKKGEARPVWKKVSIFFQLEYWKFLPVRHVLDVMHIEKNICESLLGTLLNIPGKTKDRESVCIDMAGMGIRTGLRPKTPGKKEKNLVNMEKLRLVGMKSHDCHTILHHLLPISIREHMASLMERYPQHENDQVWLKNKQNDQFPEWFKKKIETELLHDHNGITDEIRWIAEGPNKNVPTFSGYRINGVSYSTKDRDDNRQVQCNGVSVVADTLMLVEKDNTVEHTAQTYYGVITSIWELDYNKFRVPIFHCNWVDINKGVKVDDLGFILVNLNKLGFVNDHFVLGKHVKQVCYIDDPLEKFWSVVLKLPEKNFHDHSDEENDGSVEIELENELQTPRFPNVDEHDDENASYMREEEEWIQLP
ncbi:uncharacterized protein LOC141660306 [Apium graveolens]|uniref:uncharacterized protein LOC141660306 n=1 Tax=Apium graveolens TaxID=4045 RepID=UPI003D7B3FEC